MVTEQEKAILDKPPARILEQRRRHLSCADCEHRRISALLNNAVFLDKQYYGAMTWSWATLPTVCHRPDEGETAAKKITVELVEQMRQKQLDRKVELVLASASPHAAPTGWQYIATSSPIAVTATSKSSKG